MHTRKNAFSYILWGLFALFLTVIYYFALHNILDELNIIPTAYVDLIVIVVAAILVELIILTDHFFKAKASPDKQNELRIFSQIFVVVIFCLFVVVRVMVAMSVGNYVYYATSNRFLFGNSTEVITTILSIICDLFGRSGASLYGLQILLGLLAALIIYSSIKMLYGSIEAYACVAALSIMPIFTGSVISAKPDMLNLLYFSIALLLVAIYKIVIEEEKNYHWMVLPIAVIIGVLSLYSGSILTVAVFLVFVIAINPYVSSLQRVLDFVLLIAGFFVGFNNYIIIDLCMGKPTQEAYVSLCRNTYNHFAFSPDITPFVEFSRTNYLLIIIVICITYVVMFLRCESDNGYSLILFIIASFAYMCIFANKDNKDFYMITILAMVGLGGSGISKIVDRYLSIDRLAIPTDYIKDESEEDEIETPEEIPVQTEVDLLKVPEVTNIPITPSNSTDINLSINYEEETVPSVMDIMSSVRKEEDDNSSENTVNESDISPSASDITEETGLSTLGMFDDYDWNDIPAELMKYDLE